MIFNSLSLGCKVNEYEVDAVEESLLKRGYKKGENPDIFIINTCSVTSIADQKSRQMIRKIRKQCSNLKCLVVMGCYSQHAGEFVAKELNADIILGTKYRNQITNLVDEFLKNGEKIIKIDEKTRFFEYENFEFIPNINKTRAYVKIQDGCNNFCSYCLIPFVRGKSRSRNKESIIEEINQLVGKGYKEVVLTGIHVAGYGQDLSDFTFSDLVEKIMVECPKLHRLRISSIEESEIDDKLISLLKKYDRIASHIHIPTQSGCSTVLQRMHRKYNVDDFYNKISLIREARPDIAVTTDVIVGFPGETDEEFNQTYDFIKRVNFAELHVFPFSSREGTVASKMKDQVDPKIKKIRAKKLLELSEELFSSYKKSFEGKEIEFLIEDYDENSKLWNGHSSNYLPVQIKSDENLHGKLIKIIYKI